MFPNMIISTCSLILKTFAIEKLHKHTKIFSHLCHIIHRIILSSKLKCNRFLNAAPCYCMALSLSFIIKPALCNFWVCIASSQGPSPCYLQLATHPVEPPAGLLRHREAMLNLFVSQKACQRPVRGTSFSKNQNCFPKASGRPSKTWVGHTWPPCISEHLRTRPEDETDHVSRSYEDHLQISKSVDWEWILCKYQVQSICFSEFLIKSSQSFPKWCG